VAVLIVSSRIAEERAPQARAVATIPLQQVKLVSYYPADDSWTNMWSHFNPAEILADFGRVDQLGANTVRISIDPFEFGWPYVSPQMASELGQVLSLAGAEGLHVQLTLFDWWSSYLQIHNSELWLSSLLAGYANDRQVAFIELQNEIDPADAAAMAWARAVLAAGRSVVGDIPLTFSISSTAGLSGILALRTALAGEPLSFYDIHYYGSGGAAASFLAAVKAAVIPTPLFVGEAGFSTYTTGEPAQQGPMESGQASFYAGVEAATASLGLPAAAPFMLDDLVGSGVPWPESTQPQDWYYGLYGTDGRAKPAAAVVQQFFRTGLEPLLLDPGFETGVDGVPTGWAYSGPGVAAWSSSVARTGSRSVEIVGGSGELSAWRALINTGFMDTGEKLQATVWAEGPEATGSNLLSIAWFDASNDYLSHSTSSPLPSGSSTWTELSVDAMAPPGAAYAVLYLQSIGDTGTVWFDNPAVAVAR
jgi:hypothetical protein